MKRVLITGAGGFIGGFLVEEALSRSYETWAGVRPSTDRRYLADPRIRFIDLDFARPVHLVEQLRACKAEGIVWDCIVHNLGVTKCRDPRDFERVNAGYVRHFADALVAAGMVPERFLLMSSLGAWGAGDERTFAPIRPSDPPRPQTRYGLSKRHAEEYLESLPGFPYLFLRPTGVYGPRERDYLLMMQSVKRGVDFGAGYRPQRITFIYVKDLARLVFCALERSAPRRAYFASEPRGYSASEFGRLTAAALGKRFLLPVRVPLAVLRCICAVNGTVASWLGKCTTLNRDKYRILKQRNWMCDTTPLREELGFETEYDLKRGVDETVAWYRENGWL